MPLLSKTALFRIIPFLARYMPIMSRGLAIAFFVAAASTAALGIGNYASAVARYSVAGLFLFFGIVSFMIGCSVKPILRWLMRLG